MAEGVTTSVIGKVVDSLFGVAKKEITYMWHCKENVEKLKNEAETLKLMRGEVQQQIDNANRKGDNLLYGVQEWMETVNKEISTAETFLKEEADAKKTCFKLGICGNWGTLHRYGKRATKMTPSLLQHQVRGIAYKSCVSVETPAPGLLDVYQNKNLDDIDTHNSALGDIIAAIEDDSIQIIGIYGLGGVGKTTLAKEVASKMKNHFDDVAFTTVSQSVNVGKVQKDIEEATKKIMQGKKILIILDDVWKKLNLEELCIPYGINHMNCKILLTSRSEDLCDKMNVQSKICVNSLPTKEAWILFNRVVGDRVENDADLKRVAMKVAEECGGLPLLIQALANALKNKSIGSWDSALARLKKHAPLDIDPDIRKAYTHLELSYDYLESEEAKSCFLLCSMFPEDRDISLDDLVYYGVGLAKFNKLDSLKDARDRVLDAVNLLTSSCLLLKSEEKEYTKMHDVVRDVALSIASKGNNNFLVDAGKGLTQWMPRKNSTLESYTGISLMVNRIDKLPDYEYNFPHLDTFLIPVNELSKVSNEFFVGMKEVRILDMAWNNISSLPQSLKLLTKLRMLNLERNESLHEISILGELKDLEILLLSHTGIVEIPQEIGQLVNLRRLQVDHCKNLSHISPGVLSKLCWLEELCIGFYLVHDEEIYGILVEVMNLSKLTYLDLFVPRFDVIPEGIFFKKMNGFLIQTGHTQDDDYKSAIQLTSEHRLRIAENYPNIPFLKSITKIIEVNLSITLAIIRNINNIMPTLYDEGFHKLLSLGIYLDLICLVDTRDWDELKTEEKFFTKLKHLKLVSLYNLEVLWYCPDQYISLRNLVTLKIYTCPKLVRPFSVSVAQGLVSLQDLHITNCSELKEVIWGGNETEMSANIIVFPCLARISFERLNILESFCSGNSAIKYPSLVEVKLIFCDRMKIWGHGIQDTPKLKFVNDVPVDGLDAINGFVTKSWEELNKKKVSITKKTKIPIKMLSFRKRT